MIATPTAIDVPLRTDQDGVIRIGKTRVTLQSVIADFHRGATPEEIAHHFPVLRVSDMYLVIGYYLEHREEVDEYVSQQKEKAEAARRQYEHVFPQEGFREILLARLEEKKRNQE